MKHLRTTAILIGLAAYLYYFYAAPMPSLPNDDGLPLLRGQLIGLLLLFPKTYIFTNWFGTPARFELADRLPVLLGAGAILAWAALLGWLLLAAFRLTRFLTRLETAIFAAVVGLNVLSTWTLLMGLLGHLERLWLIAIPASLTCVVGCVYYWSQRCKNNSRGPTARGSLPSDENGSSEIIDIGWLWLGLPFVVAMLLTAMLPPLDFDVCEYHLQAPKEFLQQGRIAFLPHNVYANMPLGTEMLSLLGMVLAGDWWLGALVGKTVTCAFTPLCALAIFAAGRRLYSTGVGVVASLVYISIPWIVDVSSAGLVEGVSACYFFLALYALLLSNESQKAGNSIGQEVRPTAFVVLAGYLAGGAVATKYPAVLFVFVPLAAWTFVAQYRRVHGSGVKGQEQKNASPRSMTLAPSSTHAFESAFSAVLVFVLAATVGCGLWLGKNWAFTGNPTYPLLYEVFGGKNWDAAKDRQWNKAHRAHDYFPELLGRDLSRVVMTSEFLSPLTVPLAFLAFCPFVFSRATVPMIVPAKRGTLPWASRQLHWGLLAYAIFYIAAWWLLTHRIDRFWLPMLPALALLAGVGAYWSSEYWWRRVLAAMLLVGLASNFLMSTGGAGKTWFIPLEQLRDSPPLWITPWHWYLNNDSSAGTVLTVGDAAVFDLKAPVLYNTCFDDCVFEQLVKDKTAEEIRDELASRHIAYVYINWSEIARYRDTYGFTDFVQPKVFDRLVKQGILEPVPSSTETSGRLYRVTP
jgi:hypothetical protein